MKMFSFAATVLLAAGAIAGSHVEHGYSGALRGIALDNACVTANEVRTINAVKHCTEMKAVEHVARNDHDNSYTEMVCTKSEVSHMSFPRAYEKTVCAVYNNPKSDHDNLTCLRTVNQSAFLPNTIKIRTVTEFGDNGSNFPGVESNFTFPSCK